MSATYSTPPTDGQRSHPVGFNEQTYYDPFFPSSPNEEQLLQIDADYSPSHYSYQATSPPPHISTAHGGSSRHSKSPPHSYNHLQLPSQALPSNGFHPSHSPHSEPEPENPDPAHAFLSPSAYVSDNGYSGSSEHTTTPDFGSGFYLEDDFGLLEDPNQSVELNDPASFRNSTLPQDSADIDSPQHSTYTRTSLGAATLSSHLMSPVLTNSDAPGSRQATASPPGMEGDHAKHDLFPEPMPPGYSMADVQQGNMEQFKPISAVQQTTPTLTESSKGTSPDLSAAVPHIMRAPSPVVRIQSYSRGDSPARGAALLGRSGSKRSRAGSASSHLAVQNDPGTYDDEEDEEEQHGTGASFGGRLGLDPESRFQISNVELPNLRDQEEDAQIAMKNADVAEWLAGSDAGIENVNDNAPRRPSATNKRQRAKSTGAQSLSHANLESFKASVADAHIPGPGVLVNEESGDEDEEDEEEAASIDDSPPPTTALGEPINAVPGQAKPGVYDELPNQPPLYRAKLWQDPLYDSSDPGVKMQPETANAAIMRFQERAGDIETMSRVATWGTRRLSESDLEGLFRQFTFNEKLAEKIKGKRERSSSFLQQAAAKLVPRRASMLKREESDSSNQQAARPSPLEHSRNDSSGSRKDSLGIPQTPKGLQKMTSLGKRPKSPRINTGSAVAAMAFQAGALGAGGPVSATATSSPTGWPPTPKTQLKSPKSRTDMSALGLQRPSSSGTDLGLAELWNKQGGPPLPSLVAPVKYEDAYPGFPDAEDDDDDEGAEDAGVTMDLSIRPDTIVPTLDGFKSNIRQLNPRLPPFMFDRIAQEQLRRFKKLMDFKIKHAQALSMGKCQSGKHCTELGGEPTYLPSKSSSREPEVTHTGFSVAGLGQSDEDVNALAEGIVTPAQFPPGVPMPPVKRLPAEFECSLCFKVKKFHKPSDWSKHVHEDVQPFTCTFATCAEPKSFKRKADWVRHENERHRQLEWWMCNMNDCSHKCYRKDNFVQHLVREHKLPEPKVKTIKNGKPAVRGPSSQKARVKHGDDEDSNDEIDQVWKLVEECKHETPKNPKDEACKFCGNICNSWKKLTVHLAKHMEQISMPVLGVVKQKEVTSETIISPIEQRMISQQNSISPTAQSPFTHTSSSSISPFGMPVGSVGELPTGFTAMTPQNNYFAGAEPQTMNYQQRVSPNTYPPPGHAQHLAASYAQQHRGSASASPFPMPHSHTPMSHSQTPMSDYSGSFGASPAPQFNPVNASSRGFAHPQQAQPPTQSPDNIHDGLKAPTSQPRAMPYDNGEGFQYVPQQQATFSPIEANPYQFGSATSSSYPQLQTSPQPPFTQHSPPPAPFQQQTSPPPPYAHQTTPPTSYPQQQQQHMSAPAPSYTTHLSSISGGLPMTYDQMGHLQSYPQGNQNASLYNQQQQQHQQQQQQQQGYPYGQH
ncbi:hypothetical protein IMSHALPRED_002025 [Imshaugia aleurites]|uniref:C2H2-type domain-containing protein n=1 Tax=Imshaugia aleurites TaxID=172621 RepID=A0A8H3J4A5_9LECA|nr:hypothetical protein IMSHALPRED_002025 [Imshaugia aleurites]